MALHADAKASAWNVGYEMWMFSNAVGKYSTSLRHSQRFQHNLLLESVLVHARVICEFMFGKLNSKYPEDVRAVQFFDDPKQWKPDKSRLCPFLMDNLERMNRSLQHISFDRIRYGRNPWDIRKIAIEIQAVWDYFLRQLPEERKQWFHLALEGQRKDDKSWFLKHVGLK
jgi:hypothetical protein